MLRWVALRVCDDVVDGCGLAVSWSLMSWRDGTPVLEFLLGSGPGEVIEGRIGPSPRGSAGYVVIRGDSSEPDDARIALALDDAADTLRAMVSRRRRSEGIGGDWPPCPRHPDDRDGHGAEVFFDHRLGVPVWICPRTEGDPAGPDVIARVGELAPRRGDG
ncbi:hypothetical protein [Nocardioides sp.]|uniref:hypothetical protein n=1 Tax=Nocardioides sp. TaxID=35761 RepID=UPI003515E546